MTYAIGPNSPSEEDKRKVRPYYNELQGYLFKAPDDPHAVFYQEEPEWKQVNETIDLINGSAGKSYDRFKIHPIRGGGGHSFVRINDYKQKLAGIISFLHGEYFYDEPPPFSGMPSTVITHNLTQQQSQQQSMTVTLLELQSKIDNSLSKTTNDKERSFLTALKEKLSTITSVVQLVQSILNIAHQSGLDPLSVSKLLS